MAGEVTHKLLQRPTLIPYRDLRYAILAKPGAADLWIAFRLLFALHWSTPLPLRRTAESASGSRFPAQIGKITTKSSAFCIDEVRLPGSNSCSFGRR
jgi:hypothetical protein